MANCELTHLARSPIDVVLANDQHRHYCRVLASLGCRLLELAAEPRLPDSVFVEDTAVVLDEIAVITRPGAESRRAELASAAAALEPHRPCVHIDAPGTLDGGDVLRVAHRLFVGQSSRSNAAGIAQLAAAVGPYGYSVLPVPVRGCLHLKSAVTLVDPDTLLINDDWVDRRTWPGMRFVAVASVEPHAANAVRVGDTVVHAASGPRTRERLEAAGLQVLSVDVSEMEKAEGAVSCCSVIFA